MSASNQYNHMPNDSGNHDHLSNYHNWDSRELGIYFRNRGLGAYFEALQQHKITGKLAPLLGDEDLKEIGVNVVGDRLMFKHHLKDLSQRERYNKRIESIWDDEERIFFSECDKNFFTCNGFCPVDPSTYKLTSSHLKVKKVQPVRCGPVPLFCFGASYVSKNIDLSKVDDVDVIGIPAPCCHRTCCCSRGKDLVEVESRFETRGAGKIFLVLEEGHGESVANMILNQVEESQKIERI